MTANAVHQGTNGDCWLMAAIVALSNNKGLLDKICVAMDEKVGVYGFVFFRGMFPFTSTASSLRSETFCTNFRPMDEMGNGSTKSSTISSTWPNKTFTSL